MQSTQPVAQSVTAGSEKAKPARKRSAPMFRALKFTRLADKNVHRAMRLVGNWRGEATDEQKRMNEEVLAMLKQAAPLIERALIDVDLLQRTGFVPTEARGRAITEPYSAGERVGIRSKFYSIELHGAVNDFEVVVQVGGMVKIRPTGDVRATQLVVNRAHLELLDEAADADVDDDDDEAGDDVEVEDEEEGEEGVDADADELNFDAGS